jgi:hypothetical protein
MKETTSAEKNIWGISLIMAPAIMFISSFFWEDGRYNATGGTLVAIDSLFLIPAFMGLFSLVKSKFPRYAAWGQLVAILGCLAGANFGFADFFTHVFNISHQTYLDTLAQYPVASNLLLFQTGPLVPLSLLVLGVVLLRLRATDTWIGIVICAGAIMFPLSRISRNDVLAHISDGLWLLSLAYIGIKMLGNKTAFYTKPA